jgi:hypothetical protein
MSPDTPEKRLLEDCLDYIQATRARWEVDAKDPSKRCAHLAIRGTALVRRLEAAVGKTHFVGVPEPPPSSECHEG